MSIFQFPRCILTHNHYFIRIIIFSLITIITKAINSILIGSIPIGTQLIFDCATLIDGRQIIVYPNTNVIPYSIRIYDLTNSFQLLIIATTHTHKIAAVALSKNGQFVSTGGYDFLFKQWNINGFPSLPSITDSFTLNGAIFTIDYRNTLHEDYNVFLSHDNRGRFKANIANVATNVGMSETTFRLNNSFSIFYGSGQNQIYICDYSRIQRGEYTTTFNLQSKYILIDNVFKSDRQTLYGNNAITIIASATINGQSSFICNNSITGVAETISILSRDYSLWDMDLYQPVGLSSLGTYYITGGQSLIQIYIITYNIVTNHFEINLFQILEMNNIVSKIKILKVNITTIYIGYIMSNSIYTITRPINSLLSNSCSLGYYLNFISCLPCSNTCRTCKLQTKCTSCPSSRALNTVLQSCQNCLVQNCKNCDGNISLCRSCLPNYINLNNSCIVCKIVINDCLRCDNNVAICTKCNATSYLNSNICYKCNTSHPGCLTCKDQTVCTICAGGYLLSGTACQPCNIACKTCTIVVTNCVTCRANYNLIVTSTGPTRKSCICPTPYVVNNNYECMSCMVTFCINCISNNYCNICVSGYLIYNGSCVACTQTGCLSCSSTQFCVSCNSTQNYTLDSINGVCFVCNISNCAVCTNITNCQTCVSGYLIYNGSCVACTQTGCLSCSSTQFCVSCNSTQNYTLDSINGVCFVCNISNCAVCTNITNCQTCVSGYLIYNGSCVACTQTGCLSCSSTQFCVSCNSTQNYTLDSINGVCFVCNISNCAVCTNITNCQTCVSGYLIYNGSCVACTQTGCLSCSSTQFCVSCNSTQNYTLDSINGVCFVCNISNCAVCTNITNCQTCVSGYLIYNGSCVACTQTGCLSCSSTQFCVSCNSTQNYTLDSINGVCFVCNISNCAVCTNITNCQTCVSGYLIYNGSCVACTQTGCLSCSSTQFCVSCNSTQNYTLDSINGVCFVCNISNCAVCTNITNCQTCVSGYLIYNGSCVACTQTGCLSCSSTQFCVSCNSTQNYTLDSINGVCFVCNISNCAVCTNITNCQTCVSGYLIYNGSCVACTQTGCLSCSSTQFCVSCNSTQNYTLDSINGVCFVCNISNCAVCTNITNCQTCVSGYLIYNGSCVACTQTGCLSCSSTQFCVSCNSTQNYTLDSINGVCFVCNISNCAVCTNITNCQTCVSGYLIYNGSCVACTQTGCLSCSSTQFCVSCNSTQNYTLDSINGVCFVCNISNCAVCTNITNCQTCVSGYLIYNGSCVACTQTGCLSCSSTQFCVSCNSTQNYTLDSINGVCFVCNISNCAVCTNITNCQTCVSGYLIYNGSCVACTQTGCLSCSSTQFCVSCNSTQNYTLDSINGVCFVCNISNCAVCTNITNCQICFPGFLIYYQNCLLSNIQPNSTLPSPSPSSSKSFSSKYIDFSSLKFQCRVGYVIDDILKYIYINFKFNQLYVILGNISDTFNIQFDNRDVQIIDNNNEQLQITLTIALIPIKQLSKLLIKINRQLITSKNNQKLLKTNYQFIISKIIQINQDQQNLLSKFISIGQLTVKVIQYSATILMLLGGIYLILSLLASLQILCLYIFIDIAIPGNLRVVLYSLLGMQSNGVIPFQIPNPFEPMTDPQPLDYRLRFYGLTINFFGSNYQDTIVLLLITLIIYFLSKLAVSCIPAGKIKGYLFKRFFRERYENIFLQFESSYLVFLFSASLIFTNFYPTTINQLINQILCMVCFGICTLVVFTHYTYLELTKGNKLIIISQCLLNHHQQNINTNKMVVIKMLLYCFICGFIIVVNPFVFLAITILWLMALIIFHMRQNYFQILFYRYILITNLILFLLFNFMFLLFTFDTKFNLFSSQLFWLFGYITIGIIAAIVIVDFIEFIYGIYQTIAQFCSGQKKTLKEQLSQIKKQPKRQIMINPTKFNNNKIRLSGQSQQPSKQQNKQSVRQQSQINRTNIDSKIAIQKLNQYNIKTQKVTKFHKYIPQRNIEDNNSIILISNKKLNKIHPANTQRNNKQLFPISFKNQIVVKDSQCSINISNQNSIYQDISHSDQNSQYQKSYCQTQQNQINLIRIKERKKYNNCKIRQKDKVPARWKIDDDNSSN